VCICAAFSPFPDFPGYSEVVAAGVIVLGAGAAGLAAARALSRAGIATLVLEARQRIGGRIHTVHEADFDSPLELGAEFVHGKPPQIWSAIASGRLQATEAEGEDWCFHDGRLERPEALFRATGRLTDQIDDAPEQSFVDFLQASGADEDAQRWAAGYIEGFHAARIEEISVRSLAVTNQAEDEIEGDRSFRLRGGYGSLVDWLKPANGLVHIRLDAAATAVTWKRGHVTVAASVSGRAEQFEAERCICTIPLGVLAAGSPQFEPEPRNLRDAIGAIAMGHAARITLRFRRRVWEDRPELRGLGFLFSQERWMPTWWTAAPAEAPLITGWMGGPRAEAAPPDPAEWLDPALATLGKLLSEPPDVLRREMVSWHAHNWTADPFARGAYTYVRVGGLEAQRRFGLPVEDTLYFAGEATDAEGYWSTVHGAMASGERAARLILDSGVA
jgi:monoamine oxidase